MMLMAELSNLARRNFVFEKTTTILYNAQGDKAEERTAMTNNSAFSCGRCFNFDRRKTVSVVLEQSPAG